MVVVSPVLGGGGDWKMGPFGPYWDDNSWPEFTPMYWMEEFMNRLDDDDDEIQTWMLRNQYSGQRSGTNWSGAYPEYGQQPNSRVVPQAHSEPGAYVDSYANTPDKKAHVGGGNKASPGESESESGPLPYLTPDEFARMPIELQRAYRRAFDREYPIAQDPKSSTNNRPLPRLTRQEFARMPAELQREYKRAYEHEYPRSAQQPMPAQRGRPLPNISQKEFSRMPAHLQREYKRAFDREYADYLARMRDAGQYRSKP